MYKLLYTDEARKQILKLDEQAKPRIRQGIEQIAASPEIGKMLTAELKGRWSYRVGDYRIIYRVYRTEVVILILEKTRMRRQICP